jgi:hypothetical protein
MRRTIGTRMKMLVKLVVYTLTTNATCARDLRT